jgi:L-malate glycosyltransferase
VDVILRAVALLQKSGQACQLQVGNTGSLSDKLKTLANEFQLKHCQFIGRVDEISLPELLTESDVYLSAAVTDGTSVTLLQAMAMSVPVVVSNSPGNPTGPLGRTFETGNADSLVQEILACLSHPEQTLGMTERARIHVQESANWSKNVLRLQTLIKTVQQESS